VRKPARKQSGSFGQGITPSAKQTTCKAIERRLLELVSPLVEQAGGYVTSLEDVGEEQMAGLAIVLSTYQAFDILILEATGQRYTA
jgi:hypothetical protein